MNLPVFEKIKRVMIDNFEGLNEDDILPDLTLYNGGLDISSLETVIFYLAIEEEFGIELPDDAYSQVHTIEDLVKCVEDCLIK